MKKILLVTLLFQTFFAFGDQLNVKDYREKFFCGDCLIPLFDPGRVILLINKIKSCNSKSKKKIFLVNLEIEIEDLENRIMRFRDVMIEHDPEFGKDEIEKCDRSLKILSEWKEQHL